jgi:hypothetical protein
MKACDYAPTQSTVADFPIYTIRSSSPDPGRCHTRPSREARWGKERARHAVQVVSSFLKIFEDEEAFIEGKKILL